MKNVPSVMMMAHALSDEQTNYRWPFANRAGTPTFRCKPVRGEGNQYSDTTVQFKCPKCGKINSHGHGNGHRVSHCPCWPEGYELVMGHLCRHMKP